MNHLVKITTSFIPIFEYFLFGCGVSSVFSYVIKYSDPDNKLIYGNFEWLPPSLRGNKIKYSNIVEYNLLQVNYKKTTHIDIFDGNLSSYTNYGY